MKKSVSRWISLFLILSMLVGLGPAPVLASQAPQPAAPSSRPARQPAFQPGTGHRLWAGTSNAGVWLYQNGVWEQRSNGLGNVSVHSLQANPFNHNVLLAVTSNGVYRTSDGGQNWFPVTMPFTQSGWNVVFWDRANAGEVVISGPDMGEEWFNPDPRAAVSYDGGQSWTGIDLDPRDAQEAIPRDVWGLDGQWYILAYSIYNYPLRQCHRSIFWRSGDHGQTWEAVCT